MGAEESLSCLFWKSDGGRERKPLKNQSHPEHGQAFCMGCGPPRDGTPISSPCDLSVSMGRVSM